MIAQLYLLLNVNYLFEDIRVSFSDGRIWILFFLKGLIRLWYSSRRSYRIRGFLEGRIRIQIRLTPTRIRSPVWNQYYQIAVQSFARPEKCHTKTPIHFIRKFLLSGKCKYHKYIWLWFSENINHSEYVMTNEQDILNIRQ